MKFKVGDVVKLKSGGQKITIAEIDYGRNIAECKWMTKDGKIDCYFFGIDILKKVK